MKYFLKVLAVIGIIILLLSNVVGLGSFLYIWAVVGLALKVALWVSFKIWISIILVGTVLLFTGIMS